MGKIKDLTGQHFNDFTVLEITDKRTTNRGVIFKCQCVCGKIVEVSGKALQNGDRKNCGCIKRKNKIKDLTNQKFGKLLALECISFTENTQGHAMWRCKCDCGNETIVSSTHLQTGHTKSCGCLSKQKIKDLTGQTFGKLIVIQQAEKPKNIKNTSAYWLCKCECGNEVIVNGKCLSCGDTKSCGCLKSAGEYKIIQLLKNNNIKFETQKSFETCRFPDTNRLAYFDFYINNNFLLEYDGPQHFSYKQSGWNNLNYYLNITKKDEFKNKWCKENNIVLKRIPYWELDNLTIKDILEDKYIYKE